ncbi:DUF6455 family protein [Pararhodobacter sp.]|uniref:DUF6455 family protein n=1 Tax=Pararhodobacter sp. TaxID=2127056 RepID=UPI002AFE8178|nr:DUF6455 family protein [Pararhodobacter sp.]
MGLFDKLDRHGDLMHRMAATVNSDVAEAIQRGRISGSDIRNAVFACVGCEGGAQCPDWLDAHPDGAEDTPDYCRNRDMLNRIKA